MAEAVKALGLKHVVVTSVTRDDLTDGGADQFAKVIKEVHALCGGTDVEVLIPDFKGDINALQTVIDAAPEILNHNLETIPRLYPEVRPMAVYERSLDLLANAKKLSPSLTTKSGIMVGLGGNAGGSFISAFRSAQRVLRYFNDRPIPRAVQTAPLCRGIRPPRRFQAV